MRATRRELFREGIRTAMTALGFAGFLSAVHWLSGRRRGSYPSVARPYAKSVGLLRPPGSLAEPAFLSSCIRCCRCQDACEPGAIQFYTERHGALAHTPYVDPAKKGCTICLKCGPACPTGAIARLTDMSESSMGSVELDPDLCLSYKAKQLRQEQGLLMELGRSATESSSENERRGPCGECYMFCPLRNRAITLEPGAFLAPIVHVDHCVGCGMCEEICRTVVRGEPAIRVVRTRHPHRGEPAV